MPRDSALNSGYHLAYLIGAAAVAIAIVVAVVVLRSEPAAAEAGDAEGKRASRQPAYSEAA